MRCVCISVCGAEVAQMPIEWNGPHRRLYVIQMINVFLSCPLLENALSIESSVEKNTNSDGKNTVHKIPFSQSGFILEHHDLDK